MIYTGRLPPVKSWEKSGTYQIFPGLNCRSINGSLIWGPRHFSTCALEQPFDKTPSSHPPPTFPGDLGWARDSPVEKLLFYRMDFPLFYAVLIYFLCIVNTVQQLQVTVKSISFKKVDKILWFPRFGYHCQLACKHALESYWNSVRRVSSCFYTLSSR